MQDRITVVGSINLDLVIGCARVPHTGETVSGDSFATHHGGKGANQAVGVARLGHPVAMVGCVGDDSYGRELREALLTEGVLADAVHTVLGSSGVALIQVETGGANRITVVPGANAQLRPELLEDAIAEDTAMVLTQLETPAATVAALASLCQRRGLPLMLDPAPATALPDALLQEVTWLTPNATEAATLLGMPPVDEPSTVDEAIELCRRLLNLGPAAVLLKLGGMGAVTLRRGELPVVQAAFAVEAVDTTAAGDACNAAFATALVRGTTLPGALRYACAAAGLSVTRSGAQPSLPTDSAIRVLLQSHGTSA